MKKSSPAAVPILLAILVVGGWGWFWYQPKRTTVAQLRQDVTNIRSRIADLQVELARAKSADLSSPVGSAKEAEERWAEVVELLESAGFVIERVELGGGPGGPGPPPTPAPTPAPPPSAPSGAAPSPGPGAPEGPSPDPGPFAAPGSLPTVPPGAVAPAPAAQLSPQVTTIKVTLRFKGDYTKLRASLDRAVASIPGLGLMRLEMEGQGDGVITVNAELAILALSGGRL